MKRFVLCLCICALICAPTASAYNDHRNHNVDSLELLVSRFTPDRIASATQEELVGLETAYRQLMLAYSKLSNDKCEFYARKALTISKTRGWELAMQEAYRYIGMHFYAHSQWDSAHFYYSRALESLYRMENGATSATHPEGYSEKEIDDAKSALYGTIGNIYNMQDSLDLAMEYYAKAGGIYEKWGWHESSSVLHYNLGETWVEEGNYAKAFEEYDKALSFARQAGDSLLMANVWKGLGKAYLNTGRTGRALRAMRKAEAFYSTHSASESDEDFHLENLDNLSHALAAQKKQLHRILWLVCLVMAVAGTVTLMMIRRRKRLGPPVPKPEAGTGQAKLNEREIQILRRMADGKTTAQIADEIFLSSETVKWYRKKLFQKFDVSNAAELIRRVTEEHII